MTEQEGGLSSSDNCREAFLTLQHPFCPSFLLAPHPFFSYTL